MVRHKVNWALFEACCSSCGYKEGWVWESIGIRAGTGAVRKSEDRALQMEKIEELSRLLKVEARLLIREGNEASARAHAASGSLKIADDAKMESIYEDLKESDFVYVFSCDGFLEADREFTDFFNMVADAVTRGVNVYYFSLEATFPQEAQRILRSS